MKWQPIETAPEEIGDGVLLHFPGTMGTQLCIRAFGQWETLDGFSELGSNPTHWMPLPEPPSPIPLDVLARRG